MLDRLRRVVRAVRIVVKLFGTRRAEHLERGQAASLDCLLQAGKPPICEALDPPFCHAALFDKRTETLVQPGGALRKVGSHEGMDDLVDQRSSTGGDCRVKSAEVVPAGFALVTLVRLRGSGCPPSGAARSVPTASAAPMAVAPLGGTGPQSCAKAKTAPRTLSTAIEPIRNRRNIR